MTTLFEGEELAGEVVGVIYEDTDTGFGVVELAADAGEGARCAGPLAGLVEGQRVKLVGRHTDHPTYGPTFDVTYYEQLVPETVAGLRSFLESERFAEVDDRAIARVLTEFGAGAGRVIEQQPERLVEQAGLDRDDADALHRAWVTGQALATLVRVAEPAGLPMSVVRAVHARFGADAPRLAREEPYALLDVDRVRFAHADALARAVGIAADDPRRLAAGTRAAVAAARRSDGHEYLTRRQAIEASGRLLKVDALLAGEGLDEAAAAGTVELTEVPGADGPEEVVYPSGALRREQRLAEDVARLLAAPSRLTHLADRVEPSDDLTSGQAAGVRMAFSSAVTVLTGGPGTGKTRAIEEVVRAAEEADLAVALCAPTGRAAKRIEELVGGTATTVHRLLDARPLPEGGFMFGYGAGQRLPHDLVVCDEMSMADTRLAGALLAAVDDGAHLLLVGDPDQLPSVGPGDVLRDLVRTEPVATVSLTEVHRQAAGSRVVSLAREIDAGEVGPLKGADGEVFMAEEPRRHVIVPRVVEAVANRAPDYFGVEPGDIQVLAPVYRGPTGVDALNEALEEALNPAAGQPDVAGFQAGDRVMQTRNDADLDVSNGDVGTVVDVDAGRGRLRVAFPRGEVTYERDQAGDLTAAWAITVHKSQGGEWPVVVLVVDRSHRGMLWRNLVYTAVTRASEALIVVGQAAALREAARRDVPRNRQTALAWRIEAAVR